MTPAAQHDAGMETTAASAHPDRNHRLQAEKTRCAPAHELLVQSRTSTADQCRDASISQTAYGVHFAVRVTSESELIGCGAAQRVPFDKVRIRCSVKRNANAHSSTQQLQALPSRHRKVYEEQDGRGHTCVASTCMRFSVRSVQVRQVSCGISHCIVLAHCDADTKFFAWGHGLYGQLGLGECQFVDTVALIDSPSLSLLLQHTADVAVELRCGPFSTYVFVKGTSTIVHWGLLPSSDPLDKFVSQGVPAEFPAIGEDIEITDVAVGLEHIVILSSTGHLFTWGFGQHGQLGLGHKVTQKVDENAQRVDFFNRDITTASIACGWHHTLALASDKSVFAWGSNRLGACGATTKFHEYFHPVRATLPSAYGEHLDYSTSCCGDTSMLKAQSSDGAVTASYMWGVCSSTLLSLAPMEISDIRCQHPKFVGAKAGFGTAHWLYVLEQHSPAPGSNILFKVAAIQLLPAELRHRESSDIESCDLHVGSAFVVRAQLLATIPKPTAIISPECVRVSERSASMSDGLKLLELVACTASSSDGAMEITLKAVSAGSSWLSLSYGNALMLGTPIRVHIREAESIGNSNNSANTITAIGVCVVDATQEP